MSPAERRFWLAAQRRAAGLQPEIHRALLRAFQIIRDSLNDSELTYLIESGRIDDLLNRAFDEATMDRAFAPVRDRIRNATRTGFVSAVRDTPGAGKIDGVLAIRFDYLSPYVVEAIRTLETKVITTLSEDIRATVKATVEQGIRDGVGPRTTARALRDVIGMSPTQAKNALKYEERLTEEGATNIAKKVAAYEKRAIALNAETNARTATLDAYKRGQQLAWEDAINKGVVERGQLQKTWVGVMDDRERPEHVAMEQETVPFDAMYSNGEMVPGESTYNCRCISRISAA